MNNNSLSLSGRYSMEQQDKQDGAVRPAWTRENVANAFRTLARRIGGAGFDEAIILNKYAAQLAHSSMHSGFATRGEIGESVMTMHRELSTVGTLQAFSRHYERLATLVESPAADVDTASLAARLFTGLPQRAEKGVA